MSRKYDLILDLYNQYSKKIVSSSKNWEAFLNSACRNYKLRFDEQLLVYAQKPEATAVLEIRKWNKKFDLWVNEGASGIAVFEDIYLRNQGLVYYFDISDTHKGQHAPKVPIWKMMPEYSEDVINVLEKTFGKLKFKKNLDEAILSASENAVIDHFEEYVEDLIACIQGSLLDRLDHRKIIDIYQRCLINSVAYMIMSRLDRNPSNYFHNDDFNEITNFNTPDTICALGVANRNIVELGLNRIAKTIFYLEKRNQINVDNKSENRTKRIFDYEKNRIHNAEQLSFAEIM